VFKPAQAEAERITTLARAQADATKLSAEAAAAEGRIALDQLVIQQLPSLLSAAADGLNGANLTVLNGADGLNSLVASLAGQGLAVLESVRRGLDGVAEHREDNELERWPRRHRSTSASVTRLPAPVGPAFR
jgi:flotillin